MKTRAITAFVMLIIVSVPLYFKGLTLDFFILGIGMFAAYELNKMYKNKFKLPVLSEIYFYLCLLIAILMLIKGIYSWLPLYALILGVGINIVLHKDLEDFGLSHMTFYTFNYTFIFLALSSIYKTLDMNFNIFLYPIITAVVVDTAGYLGGYFFGKRKLIPEVSPKKTIEGAISSTFFGTLIGTAYLLWAFDLSNISYAVVLTTFVVSIFSQFGDLFASAIKREFKIKDFSSIFPGHGGVLDRIDGIIFNFLIFTLIFEVALRYFL